MICTYEMVVKSRSRKGLVIPESQVLPGESYIWSGDGKRWKRIGNSLWMDFENDTLKLYEKDGFAGKCNLDRMVTIL